MRQSEIEYTESVDLLNGRVAVPSYYFEQLPKELREMSFTVSNLETLRQIEMVKTSLGNALKEGLSFTQWKENLNTDILKQLSKARLETVFRTNVGVVYGQITRHNAYTSDVTPYLMYSATGDDRTRESHMKLDGTIKRADSKFWDKYTPSWDFNCRCDVVPLSAEDAKAKGITKGTPKVDEDGFGERSLGNISGDLDKQFNKALNSLPEPYKSKFKKAQEQNKNLVDIWFEKNQAIFKDE